MKKDNRGFTLSELLVCVVIFGVVLASIFGFMLASSNSYNKINDRLDVQLQAQLAANQASEFIIDCNTGIAQDATTLYIIYETAPGKFSISAFKYIQESGKILYGKVENAVMKNGVIEFSITPSSLLSDHVTAFSATVNSPEEGGGINTLTLQIGLEKRSAKYTVYKTVAMRNKPSLFTIEAGGAASPQ